MVVHRRKKVVKYRGSVTHGGGSRKKRRGSGSRGGRGHAGSGKRSGHRKRPLGRHGFTSLTKRVSHAGPAVRSLAQTINVRTINVGNLTPGQLKRWTEQGLAREEKGTYAVDLGKAGYGKLLGAGSVSAKIAVTVPRWSAQAEQKIAAAGGSLTKS